MKALKLLLQILAGILLTLVLGAAFVCFIFYYFKFTWGGIDAVWDALFGVPFSELLVGNGGGLAFLFLLPPFVIMTITPGAIVYIAYAFALRTMANDDPPKWWD